MKKITLLLVLACGFNLIAEAQQIPFYTQYYRNAYIYNPAFAGTEEDVNVFLMHRAQWRDIEGSPVTSALSVDGPVKSDKIGLGFNLYNDVSNILERTGISTSYSYKVQLADEHNLFFGLQIGVLDNRVNFSKALVNDANDPMLYNPGVRKISLDAGFGVGYRWNDLEAGVYVPQLPSTRVDFPGTVGDRSFYNLSRHYLGSLKYTFTVNEDKGMTVYPMILGRYIPGAPVQLDVNGVFDWENRGWVALSYKHDYAVAINLGIQLKEGLSVGYAYDYITKNIGAHSGASHEIVLGYRFGTGKKQSTFVPQDDTQNLEIQELKEKTQENAKEINELREQLLKRLEEQKNNPVTPEPTDSTTGDKTPAEEFESGTMNNGKDFVTDSGFDFVDPDGNPVEKGMYVILGAFKNIDNAQKAIKEFKSRGYPETSYFFNTKLEFYEVYSNHPSTSEEAVEALMTARKEYPDAWILILE